MAEDRPAASGAEAGPVHFRDVLAVGEYRAMYLANLISQLGDYLARAAIVVLVYQQSQSLALSAASFAISYLPWIVGGPLLAAVAERYPYRRVLIIADLARAVPIALIAIPGMPVPAILALLFVAMLGAPPTQAARSALIPLILDRRLVVTGLALNTATGQATQVFGYLAGATIAASIAPNLGLAIDAVTFAASGLIIAAGVRPRPAATASGPRRHLMRETGEGFRLVFGTPLLRAIAIMVFSLTTFTILPEGLAAGWAAHFTGEGEARGFAQGVIMAAGPVGFVFGGILVGRIASTQHRRHAMVRPFSVVAPVALALSALAPNPATVAVFVAISGVAQGVLIPALNGLFVLALPHGFRARAFGVMQGGLQLTQGAAVMLSGLAAQHWAIPPTVGLWSLGGLVLMAVLAVRWPGDREPAPAPSPQTPPPAPGESASRVTPGGGGRRTAGRLDG